MSYTSIEQNKELVSKYPFLAYKEYDFNTDSYCVPDDYDYSETWADSVPDGWWNAFGLQMCEEMKEALDEYNYSDKYIIIQIKEKYGQLRIYDNGIPKGCRVWDVIKKYSDLSEVTCIRCGKPAIKHSLGWICPWCDECAEQINGQFVEIKKED